jgi:uncharacterized membrane-anchored protein YitT (DUF2179 family)
MSRQLKKYLTIIVGTCISGIALNAFFLPNHLLSGGVTGLSVILYYLFGWPVDITNLLFNVPLFFLAYRIMSREYFLCGLFGTFALSFWIRMFSFLKGTVPVMDPMLSSIAAGVLYGIGLGTLYRVGGNTGGTDIIGGIVQKFYSISIGTTGFLINLILLCIGAFCFGLAPAMYTMVAYFCLARTSNAFAVGFDYKKNVFIISEHSEAVAEAILQKLGRGATYMEGEGAYTHERRKVLFCVVKLTQMAHLKDLVVQIDPDAFMIVQDAREVLGRGFTMEKNHNIKRIKELQ